MAIDFDGLMTAGLLVVAIVRLIVDRYEKYREKQKATPPEK